jgi:hypothetical protein
MNTPMNDNFPQMCSEDGHPCETCIAESARHLAAICKGLRGKAIGQLFVQILPNSTCAPMHKRFAAHYIAASALLAAMDPGPVEEPVPERREVMSVRPRTRAAVA